MTESKVNIDVHFLQLVLSLQAGTLQQMGKIASPVSGKVERNLDVAKISIDMITMLQTKMAGNLTREEKEFIEHVLYELRLNYVDEVKKDEARKAGPAPSNEESPPAATTSEETAGEQNHSATKPSDPKES